MVIKINGFPLNDSSSRVFLHDEIEGLDFPAIRTSKGALTGDDGGYVGPQYLDSRDIAIQGAVFSSSVSEARAVRRELQAGLKLAPDINEVQIEDDDGSTYLLYAHLVDFKMPIKGSFTKSLFKIELLAPDPIIYDNATGSELTVALSRKVAGGVTWPLSWPIVWGLSTPPAVATNNGTVFMKPKIILTGAKTNPVVTNLTTGQSFGFNDLVTSAGDVVEIDMRARTVTLNGGNIYDRVSASSRWWGLVKGPNTIQLETGSGSDNPDGTLTWRNGVMGI